MSSSDPSGFVRNPPSVIVKVQGTSQETMNGQLGVVIQFNADRGRYLVHMSNTQQTVALKPEHLVKGNMIDQAKAQFQLLTKNPQVKQEFMKYYNFIVSTLPPGVKPEYAAGGLGVLLLLISYFVGFTRVVMLMSLILMIGLIIGPDVFVNGRVQFQWRVVAAKFPARCRALLEQMVPMLQGKLSDKVAAAIVLFFLLASARSIVLPTASKAAVQPPVPSPTGLGSSSSISKVSIEEAYKHGFQDASNGKEFGTSLPKPPAPIFDDPVELPSYTAYAAPPQPWYSKLGIWQMMSIFNIGRTIHALGVDPSTGTFSAPLAVANLQQANPMQLGLLGFSIYSLIKVFF